MSTLLAIDLANMPAPTVFMSVDYETYWQGLKEVFNAQQPLLLDDNQQPVIAPAQLLETDNGNYWVIPADDNAGRFDLRLPLEPVTRLLMTKAYDDSLKAAQFNQAIRDILPAYATGDDLDQIALRFGTTRRLIQAATANTAAVYEDDDSLRRRMLLTPESQSAGGASGWYLSHTLDADSRVKDAMITSPEPCDIVVTVLSTEGNGTATADLLQVVSDALHDQYTRVQGDRITVQSAEIVEYSVTAAIVFYPNVSKEQVIASARAAFEALRAQNERLGHKVSESANKAALHQTGVYDLTLDIEQDIGIGAEQAPFCTALNLNDDGVADV